MRFYDHPLQTTSRQVSDSYGAALARYIVQLSRQTFESNLFFEMFRENKRPLLQALGSECSAVDEVEV